MADTTNLETFLTDVADAIRNKKGTTDEIPASTFDTEIESIETGIVNNQDKDITKNGTYAADEGYTGLGTVNVNVAQENVLTPADYQTCLELVDDIKGNPEPTEGRIYGIKRLTTSSATTWERTDDSRGLVANATQDGTEVQNDFDSLYPWSDIISYDFDSSTQLATAYYGNNEFTFTPESTTVNVFTKIPRFWAKRYVDDDSYEHIEIADYAVDGFTEISERSVARYSYQNSTTMPRSISGLKPLASTGASAYRAGTDGLGTNACLLDIETVSIIQMLYLVEYADYNSQNILGYGNCGTSAPITSGGCDSLGMKSGCLVNNRAYSVIYRGMEDIFGNIHQYVDGCICNDTSVYVSYDKNNYTDTSTTNYSLLGYSKPASSGYIKTIGYDENNPFIMLPTAIGGSNSTYISDYSYNTTSSSMAVRFGGRYNNDLACGLFFVDCAATPSSAGSYYGARFILRD